MEQLHQSVSLIPSVIEHSFPVEQKLFPIPKLMYKYYKKYIRKF